MKILLAEDNEKMTGDLIGDLTQSSHGVDHVTDGRDDCFLGLSHSQSR